LFSVDLKLLSQTVTGYRLQVYHYREKGDR